MNKELSVRFIHLSVHLAYARGKFVENCYRKLFNFTEIIRVLEKHAELWHLGKWLWSNDYIMYLLVLANKAEKLSNFWK